MFLIVTIGIFDRKQGQTSVINGKYAGICKMARGRPSDYKPDYCDIAITLGKEGHSFNKIAVTLGTSRKSMERWAESYPEFRAALERSYDEAKVWWEDQGRNGMREKGFNAFLYKYLMSCRFRDEYTERSENTIELKGYEEHLASLKKLSE